MSAGTMKIALVTALITRDSTVSIPVQCYDYEIPVLQEIHGEENVIEQGEEELEVAAFGAADAYASLLRKYPQHEKEIKAVFRSPKALAREFGLVFAEGDDKAVKHQQATIVHHDKKTAPAPAGARKGGARKTAPAPAGDGEDDA